jgi:PKD repeat protein
VWEFSNGTKSFGPNPQRAFKDNGTYDGQLTVTDETGLSATRSFTVVVSNVVPSVDAGPDTTADWGRDVAFNGQATDPGADDQPTLHYAWDFGDGSPSATGGPSVLHAYSAPGDYTATLTVCDKDEDPSTCPTDSRIVHVTKRDTSTGYTGDGGGTFDTASTVAASLVDEYGQAVNGRTITFTVDTDPALTASTNSSGAASHSYTPQLVAGAYSVLADFAGDSLYNGSNSTHSFNVSKKASSMAYTGALTGGPNKTIVLSAVLKDATGTPLGGRTVQFQLGSQTASAVTDGTGTAATSPKLTQKNGTYTVSAAWVPGLFAPLGDSARYLGSSDAKVFKLQAK